MGLHFPLTLIARDSEKEAVLLNSTEHGIPMLLCQYFLFRIESSIRCQHIDPILLNIQNIITGISHLFSLSRFSQ